MERVPIALMDPPSTITPLQVLACAVLHQALVDANAPRVAAATRAMARAWFRPHTSAFRFWCAVAGLDPLFVAARVTAALRPADRPADQPQQLAS